MKLQFSTLCADVKDQAGAGRGRGGKREAVGGWWARLDLNQ